MATTTTDVEAVLKTEEAASNVITVTELNYEGDSIEAKVDSFIQSNNVVIIAKSWCPFCRDAIQFLSQQVGVQVHVLNVDTLTNGTAVLRHVQNATSHSTVPLIYIKGDFIGGCDTVKSLHSKGELPKLVQDLVQQKRVTGADHLATAQLLPVQRLSACQPLFWFPNTINNRVVRLTGVQVFVCSLLSCIFHTELWAHYLAVGLLVDFGIRMTVGSFLSPLGMVASLLASPFEPVFKPGPPKQFAAFCGVMFSLCGTIFYFVDFEGHRIVGAIFMGMLAYVGTRHCLRVRLLKGTAMF